MIVRWYFINGLPVIWDITSILSILILHTLSFGRVKVKVPEAGLFRTSSKVPELSDQDTASFLGRNSRETFIKLVEGTVTHDSPLASLHSRSSQGYQQSHDESRTYSEESSEVMDEEKVHE